VYWEECTPPELSAYGALAEDWSLTTVAIIIHAIMKNRISVTFSGMKNTEPYYWLSVLRKLVSEIFGNFMYIYSTSSPKFSPVLTYI